MRLRVIYEILQLHSDDLLLTVRGEKNNYRVSGIHNTIKAVREIERTGVLTNEIGQIISIPAISETPLDSIILDSQHWNQARNVVTNLKNKANALSEALHDLLIQESEDSISFKIPDNSQFAELFMMLWLKKKIRLLMLV